MNIKVFQNRKIERDYFYNEGTQNENNITVLTFEVPLGYEDFSKRIVFITEDGNFWDYIPENQYELKNNITKYGKVEVYLWLTKDEQDFRSETFELNFYDNENADDLVPTEEEIDGFKTLVAELDLKIAEVEALKVEIGDFQQALNSKASKEELKEVDDKFDNYYPKAETYNKTEIDNKISVIPKFNRIVVDELPTENIQEDAIYLVPSQGDTNDLYREYIYIDNKWELIGIQKGDLSNIYTKQEVDEMVKEIQETNEYQSEIIDQFKNEFKQITVSGDSIYIPDAAELPMELVPYGEPVQTVIEEELGTTVEGESVVVSGGNPEKEVKATVNGNSYQETTEGYNQLKTLESKTNGYFSFDKDTSILTLNGTLEANGYAGLTNVIGAFPSGEYTIVVEYISGSIQNTSVANIGIGSQEWTTSGVNISGLNSSNPKMVKKVTLGDTNNNLYSQCGVGTYNNFKARLWVASGTYTLSTIPPYEPYTNGASPNTEYKQDIEVIDGVNRLDVHDLSEKAKNVGILVDEDNYVFISSSSPGDSRNWAYENANWFKKLKAGTHTIYVFVKNKPTSSNSLMHIFNKENTIIGSISYNLLQSDIAKVTITLLEDTEIGIMFKLYDGVFRVMLAEGTSSDLPYLPYGHIGLVQRGKNYCNAINQNYYLNTSVNGCGNITGNNGLIIPINDNTKMTISSQVVQERFRVACINELPTPESGSGVVAYNGMNLDNNSTIKTTINTTGYKYLVVNATDLTVIQIEKGSTATEYAPYIEPIVHSIDLAGNSIVKVNDEDDKLKIYVNGNCEITKKISDKFALTSDLGWNMHTLGDGQLGFAFQQKGMYIPETTKEASVLCNMLKSSTPSEIWLNDISGIALLNGVATSTMRLKIKGNPYTTIAEFKAFLDTVDMYAYYRLAEEYYKTIQLPSIEPITLFEGTNVFELVTNLGTTMALTYDYVTPSPSIDRPSEIFTVQGDYDTEKVNDNLFDKNDEQLETNKGKYHLNGSILSNVDYTYLLIENIKPNTKYTFSGANTIVESSVDNINVVLFDCYNGDTFEDEIIKQNIVEGTITTTANCTKMYVSIPYADKGTFQLVKGDKIPTIYTPHQSTNLPLTLTNELLGEIVTLTEEEADTLKLDGAGKYRRTDYGRYVCTGNETIIRNTAAATNTYRFAITNIKAKPNISNNTIANVYSNLFVANAPNRNYSNVECITIDTNGFLVIYSDKTKHFTLDQFKALLKEWYDNGEPLEVIYELANPTYEKITDETELEQLSAYDKQIAFYGINNINTYPTDNLVKAPLKIHATYSKSNKLTIQSLEDRLASLESQVTNLQDNQI